MDLLESNTVRSCRNCGEPLPGDARFCHLCSQKVSDGRITLRELWHDFVESFLNFDAKIFRTLKALFIPGKLTTEYFKGKHISYIPPVRIFLMMAVFHFAVLGFSDFKAFNINVIENKGKTDLRRAAYQATFLDQLDTAKQKVVKKFDNNANVRRALDTLSHQFKDARQDTADLGYLDFHRDFTAKGRELRIAQKDIYELPFDTIAKRYHIHGFLEKIQVRQSIRLISENANFSTFLLSKLIWMVLLMMPALALVLKLLYIRRRKYFVEHLVFSFHYHAFAFLVVGVAIAITGWFNNSNPKEDAPLPMIFAFLAIMIYLFIAMRRVYKQGFWKTFIKFNILNFSYIFIFTLFFALTAIVSVLLF